MSNLTVFVHDDNAWAMEAFECSLYVIYSCVFVCGVMGNSIVIYVLLSTVFVRYRISRQRQPSIDSNLMATNATAFARGSNCRRSTNVSQNNTNPNNINSSNLELLVMETLPRPDGNGTPSRMLPEDRRGWRSSLEYSFALTKCDDDDQPAAAVPKTTTTSPQSIHERNGSLPLSISPSQQINVDENGLLTVGNMNTRMTIKRNSSGTSLMRRSLSSASTYKYRLSQCNSLMSRLVREKLAVTNFYLLNLAISDLIYVMFIPILLMTMHFQRWIFGAFMCKFYFFTAYLCQFSSVFILVILSIDRYLSVKYPGKVASFRSVKIARLVIATSWLLSILFTMPVALFTRIDQSSNESTCVIEWPDTWNLTVSPSASSSSQLKGSLVSNISDVFAAATKMAASQDTQLSGFDKYLPPLYAFTMYTFTFNYLVPVSLIVVLYMLILRRLLEIKRASCSAKKRRSHRRITKMVQAIVICYIISWTPYWFAQIFHYIYQHLLEKSHSIVLRILSHSVQVVAYFSSAINPLIYSYMSESFRVDLKAAIANLNVCANRKTISNR